jgi:hypothetical protein
MPLDIKNHGESHLRIDFRKNYRSVQACINLHPSEYRRSGQMAGLVFYATTEHRYPDLLGQFASFGKTYDLEEGERIVDLVVAWTKPKCRIASRLGLSQVAGVTVLTNRRRLSWTPEAQVCSPNSGRITEVIWDFNAIFDRVQCIYTLIPLSDPRRQVSTIE